MQFLHSGGKFAVQDRPWSCLSENEGRINCEKPDEKCRAIFNGRLKRAMEVSLVLFIRAAFEIVNRRS